MIQDYHPFYIAYDELKKSLKTDYVTPPTPENAKPPRREWTEDDEKTFVTLLESELEKVFTFQKRKSEEIVERIQASELEVSDVVSRLERSAGNRRDSVRMPPPDDEDFLQLEEILSDIIADVHDLAKFTQLNYTGFQKIIKKHDVCCNIHRRIHNGARPSTNRREIETNPMVPQAGLCCPTQCQAFFQGQLRCLRDQSLQAV